MKVGGRVLSIIFSVLTFRNPSAWILLAQIVCDIGHDEPLGRQSLFPDP